MIDKLFCFEYIYHWDQGRHDENRLYRHVLICAPTMQQAFEHILQYIRRHDDYDLCMHEEWEPCLIDSMRGLIPTPGQECEDFAGNHISDIEGYEINHTTLERFDPKLLTKAYLDSAAARDASNKKRQDQLDRVRYEELKKRFDGK